MPVYDFECVDCGYVFDDLVGTSDLYPPCPLCHSATKRLIGCAPTLWHCFGPNGEWPHELKPHGIHPSLEGPNQNEYRD